MRIPDPKANTTTEAYLAYKAGYLEENELKPVLYEPYLHFDAWLAYWAGLTNDYPKNYGKNLCQELSGFNSISSNGATNVVASGNSVSFTTSANGRGIFMTSTGGNNYTYCPELYSTGYVCSVEISATQVSHLQIGVEGKTIIIDVDTTPKRYAFNCYGNVGERIAIIFYRRNTAGECSYTISNIQVEKGSEATDFEEYSTTPEMLTDEEALVAYLSGVTNTYPEEIKDPYDVRIVGYLKHLVSARWPEPDYPVNNEEFYLSTMKPPVVPSGDTPSSDIELDDTAEAPFIDVELYGDTEQQTYSGKNLLNPDVYQSGVNIYYPAVGFTFTNTQTSGISCSYTDTEISINTSIQHGGGAFMSSVLSAGTYHFSATVKAGSNNNARVSYSILDANRTVIDQGDYGTTQVGATRNYNWTITVPNTGVYIAFSFATSATGGGEITVSNPQLEAGSTATSYEKFVGGVPSPNPDYPQDVQVVTGEQTVTVTGKNLLVIPNGSRTENGITWTRNGNTFVGNGTKVGSSNWSAMMAFNDFRTPLPAGTYTLSIKSPVQKAIEFVIRDSSNVDVIVPRISVGKTSVTFTTTREASNYRVVSLNMTSGETLTDYTVSELQLEAGSVATSFELPQLHTLSLGSTELCKIGDYQDYIYRDEDGDWYVHKAIGKYVFNGSEDWTTEPYGTNSWRVGVISVYDYNADEVQLKCDFSSGVTFNNRSLSDATNTCVCYTNSNSVLVVRNTTMTTKEAMQTATAGKRLFYKATPTDTQITNSELISQLDALMEGGSYEGKTYVKVTATDPNLPGLLYVEAGKYD